MNWAKMEPKPSRSYARAPFEGPKFEISEPELARIAQAGFDFVRLTIDPGPFLQFEAEARDELDAVLEKNVRRFLRHGLKVIIDFHPNTQAPDYHLRRLLDEPLFSRYVEMVHRTARLLCRAGLIEDAALELMNEPPIGYDHASVRRWQGQQEQLYSAARAHSPELTIIVTGGRRGSYRGLMNLDPRPLQSEKTLFSFHYYLPFEFTAQGVANSDTDDDPFVAHFTNIPYPSTVRRFEDIWPAIEQRIRAQAASEKQALKTMVGTRRRLQQYLSKTFNDRTMGGHFDSVVAWAKRYGIASRQIFLGEFGTTRTYDRWVGAPDEDRRRWLGDVRRQAELRGFRWAIWEYKGYGGMSVMVDDRSAEFDPLALEALGLARSQ
jgi:hypothetical protein